MDLLTSLNPAQREAVLTTEGPLLLLAGAGSGKTRVLVNRVAHLVEKGVRPFNILAITFTNKAAREMRDRVGALLGQTGDVWVSTFHSMCVKILRREIGKLGYDGKFTIYDSDDSQRVMKQVFREYEINDKILPIKTVLGAISRQKDMLVGPDEFMSRAADFKERQIAMLYGGYQRRLRASNALDFDDLIFKTVELFEKLPDILNKYQNRFLYINVDEYQDTNFGQYRLVRMLGGKHGNVCVVGDDDQSIYGWRGADIRNILEFEKDFPGAKVLKLEQNYRSTKTILDAANEVISNNKRRKSKRLWTDNQDGGQITYYRAGTDLDEAAFVVDEIMSKAKAGAAYKDFAVLYRMNAQSRLFEDRLVRESVPYRVFGGVRFYERMEVKDILAYLKAIYNPLDDMSLRRIINVPRRGIGDETVSRLDAYAASMEVPFYDAVESCGEIPGLPYNGARVQSFLKLFEELCTFAQGRPVTETLQGILDKTGYINELMAAEADKDMARDRVANVMELLSKAQEFVRQAEENGGDGTLAAFLEEVALVADIDNYAEGQDVVVLMTMHSAKGLEFGNVFIVGFEEGVFPGSRAIFSPDAGDLEEERRVCYVAITRAKENLYMSNAASRRMFNETVCNPPSRFIKEIPKQLIHELSKNGSVRLTGNAPKDRETFQPGKFGAQWPVAELPKPKAGPPDYGIGELVSQKKYGTGTVVSIKPAGADYEVAVDFPDVGVKKFMAHLSKLERA